MADETLRLRAEVIDAFSGPLRNLRTMLQGVGNPAGVEKMRAGFEGTQKAAGALGREVGNTLTPALNAAGIAGLSISGALLGVGAALRSFTGSTASLSLLGRETGMTVNAMRTLEEVGKRFNIAPEAMQQSFRTFAENAQQLKKGVGEVTGFLSSQSPAVAKWASRLRRDLANGLDPDEAYKRALEFMRRIEDPIDRSRFAEKLFGNKGHGILGSEALGPIFAEVEKQIGKVPKAAEEAALRFQRSWDDIRSSMLGLRDTIGVQLLPTLQEMSNSFHGFVQSPEVKQGFADAMRSISATLKDTDWRKVGGDIAAVLGMIGSAASNTASGVKTLADALRALAEGRPVDAFRKLDDGILSKVVPKDIVPNVREMGNDRTGPLIERRDQLRRQIEVMEGLIGRKESQPDPLGGGNFVAAEERRKRDRLIDELQSLTRELEQARKERRGEATIQQQSFDGGQFGGARIQNAALAGMLATGSAVRGLSSPWGGGGGRYPAIRLPGASEGLRRTREALTGGEPDAPFGADGSIPGLSRDETQRYASILGHRESGNRYGIRNRFGFSGRWQMGADALVDTGYVKRGTSLRGLANDDAWTGKDGIFSLQQFLANEGGVQDRQFLAYTARNRRALERLGVLRPGMSAAEQAGWLAAAHLKGPKGAQLLSQGRDNVDGNGTSASSYFRMMAGIGDRSRSRAAGPLASTNAFDFDMPKMGDSDALLRRALKSPIMGSPSVDLRGGASVDINLRGFPQGTSTSGSSEGILKDLNVRRVKSIPTAGVDI